MGKMAPTPGEGEPKLSKTKQMNPSKAHSQVPGKVSSRNPAARRPCPPLANAHHPRAAGHASRLAIILRRRPKPASALAFSQVSHVSITALHCANHPESPTRTPHHIHNTSVVPPLHLRSTSVWLTEVQRRCNGGTTEVLGRCNGGATQMQRRCPICGVGRIGCRYQGKRGERRMESRN